MNCFDCVAIGDTSQAVAVCADCGAAVCAAHARVTARWLTRTMVINRVVAVEPPARTVRCTVCQAARDAASGVHYAVANGPDMAACRRAESSRPPKSQDRQSAANRADIPG